MLRRALLAGLLVASGLLAHSQKVIDSISAESCDCMEKFLAKTKIPEEDSLTNCITVALIPHSAALTKVKKLNPGTVEGIREIHARVRKQLQKKCRVFTGKG